MKKKLLIIVIMIFSVLTIFLTTTFKPKADQKIESYNYLFILNNQEDSAVFEGRILYDYNTNHTNNNKLIYINLASAEYENFNILLKTNTLYLGYGYTSGTNLILDSPYWCIELEQYLNTISQGGYTEGVNVITNYYEKIYLPKLQEEHQHEIENITDYYTNQLEEQEIYYTDQIDQISEQEYNEGFRDGIRYNETTGETMRYDFLDLVKAVSTYPIHFFTEGLDINIWGINLGALLLGIFMLGLIILIIKMIIGVFR